MKKSYILLTILLCLLSGCSNSAPVETLPPETTLPEPTAAVSIPETTEAPTVPETEPTEPAAEKKIARRITDSVEIWLEQIDVTNKLTDLDHFTRIEFNPRRPLTVRSAEPFSALYIFWDDIPGTYTLSWDGGSMECGVHDMIHEYIYLPEETTSVTLTFQEDNPIYLCNISLYTEGTPPEEEVQEWLPPCEQADILVFPTHADDEALFFGALISHYAIEQDLTVQTAFMVKHDDEERMHERLNSLWELGVRHHPTLASMPDSASHHLPTIENYMSKHDPKGWQITQIRRFKPLVIVGHDLNGEYGNAQHKLNGLYLTETVNMAADPTQYEDTAQLYGVWDTPKLYLHLYWENNIILDVNTPMEKDPLGRTPFQVAEDAYEHHVSQQQYPFYVSQDDYEKGMDCKRFGLYRSLVGEDTTADIMENIDIQQWR